MSPPFTHPMLAEARAVVADAELAARFPHLLRLAWLVIASSRGATPRQAHRPPLHHGPGEAA